MKMNEDEPTAPPHHPASSYRRVDPAGDQGNNSAADPNRQASRPSYLIKAEECVVRKDLDRYRQLRIVLIHPGAGFVLDGCAHLPIHFR